jgi:hypothetical protein
MKEKGNVIKLKKRIQTEVNKADELILVEVLDFILFIKDKHKKDAQDYDMDSILSSKEIMLAGERALESIWLNEEEEDAWKDL